MSDQTDNEKSTWTQEFEVESQKLWENIKAVLREGSARRIIVRKRNDDVLLDLPLPAGLGASALFVYLTPFIAVITAIVGLAVRLKVQVVHRVQA